MTDTQRARELLPTVTQADRNAAVSIMLLWQQHGYDTLWRNEMLAGERDDHTLVQAFASHREAALATEVIEAAAKVEKVTARGTGDQIEQLAQTILEQAAAGDQSIVAVVHPDGDWSVYNPEASARILTSDSYPRGLEDAAKIADDYEADRNSRAREKRQQGLDDSFHAASASAASRIAAAIRALNSGAGR